MTNNSDGFKLLLSYNLRPENAQGYYEFILGKYIPIMQNMGLEMSEAWHTAYGDYPSRLVCFVAREESDLWTVLDGPEWETLNDQLDEFVTDFSFKIVPYKIGFQF